MEKVEATFQRKKRETWLIHYACYILNILRVKLDGTVNLEKC